MATQKVRALSPRETVIFKTLENANGAVVMCDELARCAGIRPAHYTESRTLAMHVSRLRKVVHAKGFVILAARGRGYLMTKVA